MTHLTALTGLLLCAIGMASNVSAGPTIETDSFRLTLPDGWITDSKSRPPSMKGPKGEVFLLSSSTASRSQTAEETQRLMQEAEQRTLNIIRRIELSPSFQTVQPMSSQRLADGSTMHQLVSMTKDGSRLLAHYVVVGPRTVLLATLDLLQTDAATIDAIASALRNVQWQQ